MLSTNNSRKLFKFYENSQNGAFRGFGFGFRQFWYAYVKVGRAINHSKSLCSNTIFVKKKQFSITVIYITRVFHLANVTVVVFDLDRFSQGINIQLFWVNYSSCRSLTCKTRLLLQSDVLFALMMALGTRRQSGRLARSVGTTSGWVTHSHHTRTHAHIQAVTDHWQPMTVCDSGYSRKQLV